MNAHMITVSYAGPTNYKGSRIMLTSRRNDGDKVTFSYDDSQGDTLDQAIAWLKTHGYTVICSGDAGPHYVVAVVEFVKLKDAKTAGDNFVREHVRMYGGGRKAYTLSELRNGTAFTRGARFIQIEG